MCYSLVLYDSTGAALRIIMGRKKAIGEYNRSVVFSVLLSLTLNSRNARYLFSYRDYVKAIHRRKLAAMATSSAIAQDYRDAPNLGELVNGFILPLRRRYTAQSFHRYEFINVYR